MKVRTDAGRTGTVIRIWRRGFNTPRQFTVLWPDGSTSHHAARSVITVAAPRGHAAPAPIDRRRVRGPI